MFAVEVAVCGEFEDHLFDMFKGTAAVAYLGWQDDSYLNLVTFLLSNTVSQFAVRKQMDAFSNR